LVGRRHRDFWGDTDEVRRRLLGSIIAVASAVALGALLLPLRSHISVSTTALVLVIPVVVGAVIGGFTAGAAGVAAGFLIYDYFFIPPYKTLNVGGAQDWTALGVYVIVMLLVARVVDRLDATRLDALRGREAIRRVAEVSELLVGDQPVEELLRNIVATAQTMFNVPGVSLLELEEGQLVVVASAGEPLTPDELRQLDPHSGTPIRVGTVAGSPSELRTVALSPSGRPVGILAMRGLSIAESDRAVLNTFANDAALALERAQLREQALRSKLLEEADRFRRGLLGAVSHDLRTPLATIKVASSTLSTRGELLSLEDSHLLYQLIEIESERLTRLVTNLLDMTRIEAGVLTLHRTTMSVGDLIAESIAAMGLTLNDHTINVSAPTSLPEVNIDRVLMGQVLINLLDNAVRHAPAHSVISVKGERRGPEVVLSVADHGPGVPVGDRDTIFDRFTQLSTGGRAGLGLTIAKTFVEAHGEHVWYEETPAGGATFVLSLPVSPGARSA
jgi:two-component system, OmpR family, sensor histidine kinase KdpD